MPQGQTLFTQVNDTTAAVQQTGQEVKQMANAVVMLATMLMAVCAGVKVL